MSAERASARMNVDEFLAWAEKRPGRYELEGGVVVGMSPERTRHAEAKAAVHSTLYGAVKAAGVPCRVLPDGMTVRIDDQTAFEPDALVYCGKRLPGDAVEVPDPMVVVEVLSPGTRSLDAGAKLSGYMSRETIAHILLIDPGKRVLIHHRRKETALFETRVLATGRLRLDPPGVEFEVGDLFGEPEDR